MVDFQGLHLSKAFRCSNMSSSMGLNLFCSWCFKLAVSTEMIAIHLREVHYRLAIACNSCKSFASMSALSILDTTLGARPSLLNSAQNKKDRRRQKVTQEKVQGTKAGKSILHLG